MAPRTRSGPAPSECLRRLVLKGHHAASARTFAHRSPAPAASHWRMPRPERGRTNGLPPFCVPANARVLTWVHAPVSRALGLPRSHAAWPPRGPASQWCRRNSHVHSVCCFWKHNAQVFNYPYLNGLIFGEQQGILYSLHSLKTSTGFGKHTWSSHLILQSSSRCVSGLRINLPHQRFKTCLRWKP